MVSVMFMVVIKFMGVIQLVGLILKTVCLTPLCRNCRSSKFVKCSNNSRTTGSLHFLTDNTALIGQKIERCPLQHITCFAKILCSVHRHFV